MFSFKFCKIFQNSILPEHLREIASDNLRSTFFPVIKATYLILKLEIPEYQFWPNQDLDILTVFSSMIL